MRPEVPAERRASECRKERCLGREQGRDSASKGRCQSAERDTPRPKQRQCWAIWGTHGCQRRPGWFKMGQESDK
eukprot:254061-Chlamydomonas_euryale.AAC.1